LTSGSITSGSNALTVDSSTGYAVGDRIRIAGAGTAGADLFTTVASVSSATALTLSTSAVTTVSAAEVNYMFPAFSGGTATGGNLTWDEVGIITLTPTLGDGNYLGVSFTGTASGNIGRFYPHHFGVTGSVTNRSDLTSPGGSFTYMDEPMKLDLTVTAYNKGENPTKNYKGGFAKLDATTLGTTFAKWKCTSGTQCMGIGAVSGSDLTARLDLDTTSTNSANPSNTAWLNGASTFTLYTKFVRSTSPDGPYDTLKFGAKPLDEDGVTLPPKGSLDITHCSDLDVSTGDENNACTFGVGVAEDRLRRKLFTTKLRFGRLRIYNAFGTEKADLSLSVQAQYWTGQSWIMNNLDSSTSLPVNAFNLIGAPTGVAVSGPVSISNGQGSLILTKPSPTTTATVDLAVNLGSSGSDTSCLASHGGTPANLPWLRGIYPAGSACPGTNIDPSARATLGLYSNLEKRKAIHIRETY
jgi:hypothetical protein